MTCRAVFLDRDGVINHAAVRDGTPYPPESLAGCRIIEGVPDALRFLRGSGFKLIVVTNQPDVGRGTARIETVVDIHNYMMKTLALDDIRVCFHGSDNECECRKPKPGMLLAAAREFNIDLKSSFMVGDRWRDMDAGAAAGCRTVFIDDGYMERTPSEVPSYTCNSLSDAAQWIVTNSRR